MLIINADDLGRNQIATDRTLECHAKQRLSSSSAMVFMADSERAAKAAVGSGISVGLHANFTEEFTGENVPTVLAEAHKRIRKFLKSSKYALLLYHPLLRRQFRTVFEAQLAEFIRLYKRQPSHLDGHQHMHLSTNLLLDGVLPAGTKVRRSFSFSSGEKNLVNRLYRSAVDRSLMKRHRTTDFFFALPHHQSPERLERVMGLARQSNVELMTHPERRNEYDYLLGEEFGRAVSGIRLTGYDAL